MQIGSAIAIYFVFWWVLFFAVLPWGNRDPVPERERVAGTERGAPARPRLWFKALITSIAAAVALVILIALLNSGLTLDDIPLPGPPEGDGVLKVI
ncbi:DUF1467 family protein [Acuticoccus sp. M5D2P5]|uniref:DUF1467 family protein n=1 Tax=Acuticoccus kalidii TaxID=2910977 RepID=UPI001F43D107|nr:DUF1467 family protein [Acuticoccus kalidii]MCF3935132.1 DUF1467 family protein [Acuticoccus kalidii]